MASTILFAFSLWALLCGVLSLPVLKSVRDSDRALNEDLNERTELDKNVLIPDFDSVQNVRLVQNSDIVLMPKLVALSSDGDSAKRLRRHRREVIGFNGCPTRTIYYARRCISLKRYRQMQRQEAED